MKYIFYLIHNYIVINVHPFDQLLSCHGQEHLLPHTLDPMHIEKNVCSALFKTITNAKGTKANSVEQRQEMEALGILQHLWVTKEDTERIGGTIFGAECAPWVLDKKEFKIMIDLITSIRTPRGYGSSFQYKFPEYKISGMKIHDYHNLLHHILPIAIRELLTGEIRQIFYRLGGFFRWLCNTEIKELEVQIMVDEASEIMCLMEQNLPPAFFDIQPHQIVHLPLEAGLVGPVHYRWMYYIEQYMKVMKEWVWQMARPEGSMALGYLLFEGIHYLTEYTSRLSPTAPQLWKTDPRIHSSSLPKAHRMRRLDKDPNGRVFLEQAHAFVLRNDPCMAKWRERFVAQNNNDMSKFKDWLLSEMRAMMSVGIQIAQREWHLAIGPHKKVKFFSYLWEDGKCFRIEARDGPAKATQDSGTI
jgi:hypothetical protein